MSLPTGPSQLARLTCTFDHWENGRAILKFSDGQELIIARRYLPKDIVEGQMLELHFDTPENGTLQRTELARAILKEILQG